MTKLINLDTGEGLILRSRKHAFRASPAYNRADQTIAVSGLRTIYVWTLTPHGR